MNFTFEGNFKPRRNINLGGIKKVDDKRSLLAKAQSERKAREQERLKQKSAQHIQAFYRGRIEAAITRKELRKSFEIQLALAHPDFLTLTRQLVLFYQPTVESDQNLVKQFIFNLTPRLKDLFLLKDNEKFDSWIWLACLLLKKVLLPSMEMGQTSSCQLLFLLLDPSTYPNHHQDESRMRIITFALHNTTLLKSIKYTILSQSSFLNNSVIERALLQLVGLNPPYYYPTSPLIEKYQKRPITQYLTRSNIVRMLTLDLLTEPFLLDHVSGTTIAELTKLLALNDVLDSINKLFMDSNVTLDDAAVAGLLMNITIMGSIESGVHIDSVLTSYARTVQLLFVHLPDSYLTDPVSVENNLDIMDQDSSDEDEDDEDNDKDIVMKESSATSSTCTAASLIRARLDALYDSPYINQLLYRLLQVASTDNTSETIQSISSLFNTFMLRWPMKKDSIFNTLLYKSSQRLLQILWVSWSGSAEATLFNDDANIISNLTEAVNCITTSTISHSWSTLFLLCEVYARLLLTIGDNEFLNRTDNHANPLEVQQVIHLSRQLKTISFVMFWRANSMDLTQQIGLTGIQLNQLRSSVTHLLQQIHMRDSRRSFCPKDHWQIPSLDIDNFSNEVVAEEFNLESEQQNDKNTPLRPLRVLSKGRLAVITPRLGLLNNIPFVIPFEQRVEIFRMFVNNDKKRNQVEDFYSRPKPAVTVRRDHMFEDGFDQLNTLGVELKNKVAISFVDEFGLEEAGIDGGGVFKEFLTGLCKEAFNVKYGLFVATPEQLLYPNPSSFATEVKQLEQFRFLGLIIGKAVYEGILLDVAFAEFFLKKCLGKVNYLDDLASLDPELYKGLLAVKDFTGNVEDLSLDFTSTHIENGRSVNVDLIPNGINTPVTNQNRIQYIYAVAHYRLNVQIAKQCRAFFRGLSTIIDIKWLRMFNQQELQILLGGASVPIDLTDLRTHTVLAGFMEHDAVVQNFWRVLESFDNNMRMKFVKFVTSCSRPPLLGFKELVPKFCLRNAGEDDDRLPTSSTCVNLLKLPNYTSFEKLKEKLMYAITADAGFDLS